MRNLSITTLTAGLLVCSVSVWAQTSPCAITGDSTVSTADIQAAINGSIGASTCPSTVNIAGPGVCNAIVVQRVINAMLGVVNPLTGKSCLTSTGLHVITVNWTPSTSLGVTGYQISRGTSSGGPFTVIGSVTGATTAGYLDTTVVSGQMYYYEIAAVAGSVVGPNSAPIAASMVVPTP
jgi:Flp pilus assembly protein TadG